MSGLLANTDQVLITMESTGKSYWVHPDIALALKSLCKDTSVDVTAIICDDLGLVEVKRSGSLLPKPKA